jgi:hypothetical protein
MEFSSNLKKIKLINKNGKKINEFYICDIESYKSKIFTNNEKNDLNVNNNNENFDDYNENSDSETICSYNNNNNNNNFIFTNIFDDFNDVQCIKK